MFQFLFPRPKRKPHSFPVLEASGIKDRYLHRTSRFMRVGKELKVLNSDHNPSVIPMTPWEEHVFMRAVGDMTVSQMIRDIEAQYKASQKVPENLDKVLLDLLEVLIKDRRIIELSETPVTLPYYLSMPIHLQDEKKAREMMQRDNFTD